MRCHACFFAFVLLVQFALAATGPLVPTAPIKPPPQTKQKRKHDFVAGVLREITHGKGKIALACVSTLLVVLEVFEEILHDIPYLQKLVEHRLAKVHHGVFLLSLSHLMTTVSDLVEQIELGKAEISNDAIIHHLTEKEVFASEKSAAMAYDRAAINKFGRGAQTNFPYAIYKSYIHVDQNGRLPARTSQYRGVVWCNFRKAWIVPSAAFGLKNE